MKLEDTFKINITTLFISLILTNGFGQGASAVSVLGQAGSTINTMSSTPRFLTYKNLSVGFKIEYLPYWQKTENNTSNVSTVRFLEPLSGARFQISVFKIPKAYLLTEPKNIILSVYLNEFTQHFQPYNRTQSVSTILAGNNANKTELTWVPDGGGPSRAIILSSIIGDRLYILGYAASKANYGLFLPTAQEMINSFAIIPVTSLSSVAASGNPTGASRVH